MKGGAMGGLPVYIAVQSAANPAGQEFAMSCSGIAQLRS